MHRWQKGNGFKLLIHPDPNYFMLEKVGNREADAFSDKLAAYTVIRMLEIESNNKE